jgi:tetratricopeptide (TPR) repeat protein
MKPLIAALILLFALSAHAATPPTGLLEIQQRWARIQYQLPEKERAPAFEQLAQDIHALVEAHPRQAEPLIWEGIVLSTWAGAKGGLGALGLVKEARQSLEAALAIDETALQGSAHTSLGSLYYQVPGWPLGFGDDKKAERHLQKALSLNPDGIDPNFFFGDFLLTQGKPERARPYLDKALKAPARPGREVADAGRREEIRARLGSL